MERVSNMNCRKYVESCTEFKGSNLSGIKGSNFSGIKLSDRVYVVWSYDWYPLWACIDGKWYGHNSKYSKTTSKQTTQSMPFMYGGGDITILDTVDELKQMI